MEIFNRRRIAIALLILGLLLLAFGLWILIGLLWPKQPTQQAGQPQLQIVQQQQVRQPKTLAMPTNVQGTSTAVQVQQANVPALQEAVRRAESVVSRMGSGTSQDGFLGYDDVMMDGTSRFRNYARSEQNRMRAEHPATGQLYGLTTRVVASKVTEGKEGDNKLVIMIQAQKAEDAGDRAKPTSVSYEEAKVTLLKQADGTYLVDVVIITPIKP